MAEAPDRLAGSLVRIRAAGDRGAVAGGGLLVDERHVITCAHVAAAAARDPTPAAGARVCIDFPPFEDAAEATLLAEGWRPIAADGRGDIAVLELASPPPAGCEAPPLRRPPDLRGHRFRAYGFPAGHDSGVEAHGEIRGRSGPGWEWMQIEGTTSAGYRVQEGFSGAPVWDEQAGAVVGIVVGEDRRPEVRGAFMIPLRVLAAAWPPLEDLIGWRLRFDPELSIHWDPTARGVGLAGEPGQYFSGRVRALREIVRWLEDPDGRARVVTGDPGSGKSALLGRIVELAEPGFEPGATETLEPGTRPPPRTVDVAVAMRHKTVEQVVAALAGWLDLGAASPEDLVNAVVERARQSPPVIVMDGLDEAPNPRAIIRELLRPLARGAGRHGLRLLIGTRRGYRQELVQAVSAVSAVIDLDEPEYFVLDDLARYVGRMLATEGPAAYAERPADAAAVARAVAERASPSFLVARLVTRELCDEPEIAEARLERFPDSVADAMDLYIGRTATRLATAERTAEEVERRLRDLLAALAYGLGAGVPSDGPIWPAMASALSTRRTRYTEADAAWLLETAAGYVVEIASLSSGTHVRLFHAALVEFFRPPAREPAAHAAIARALRELVRDGWASAPRYVLDHLAAHAAAGGVLDEFLADAGYLVAANPSGMLRALPASTSPAGVVAKRTYQQAVSGLRRTTDLAERAAYLRLAALQTRNAGLAEALAEHGAGCRWRARWANWQAPALHYVAGKHADEVRSVAMTALDGRPLIISGGGDGQVHVWELATGEPFGDPLGSREADVMSVAVAELDGRPVIVSGGADETVQVHDLGTGQPIGEPLHGHAGRVACVAIAHLAGRPVIVSGGWDGTVRGWDLAAGRPIGDPVRMHEQAVDGLAVGSLDGRPLVVSGAWDRTLRICDITTGELIGEPLTGHESEIEAVVVSVLDGRPVIVSASTRQLRVWDLAERTLVRDVVDTSEHLVDSLAVGELDGRPVIASGGWDDTIRLWDLATMTQIGDPMRGHDNVVTALHFGAADGRPVIVSASADRTVRVWQVAAAEPAGAAAVWHEGTVRTLTASSADGQPVIVSGGWDGTVRMWDLGTGRPAGAPIRAAESRVMAVAGGELDGRPVVISGGDDGAVRVWDATTGARIRERTGDGVVVAVTSGTHERRPLAVSGMETGAVSAFDLGTGRPVVDAVQLTARDVTNLRTATWQGRSVVVTGGENAVHIVDLASGLSSREAAGIDPADRIYAITVTELDGHLIAVSAGYHQHIYLWDLTAGRPVREPLVGHEASIWALAVAEVGGRPVVVSGGMDQALRLWELPSGRPLGEPVLLGASIAEIRPLGSALAIAATAGLVVLDLAEWA